MENALSPLLEEHTKAKLVLEEIFDYMNFVIEEITEIGREEESLEEVYDKIVFDLVVNENERYNLFNISASKLMLVVLDAVERDVPIHIEENLEEDAETYQYLVYRPTGYATPKERKAFEETISDPTVVVMDLLSALSEVYLQHSNPAFHDLGEAIYDLYRAYSLIVIPEEEPESEALEPLAKAIKELKEKYPQHYKVLGAAILASEDKRINKIIHSLKED